MANTTVEDTRLIPAEVDFEGHRPLSRAFGDVYYDVDGPAEVERVFLRPADLAHRASDPGTTFTVGELGFGTGLNFVVTARASRARLHFISFERHPLARADFARALGAWQAELPLARSLVDAYPPLVPGWHRRLFEAGRVQLSVFFGDVEEGLADLARQQRRGVDAWFLDGFAPRRNPRMWRGSLFRTMAGLSAPRASVTSFSAAGHVRRDLQAAGFDVRRVDQRPHKRHTTAAVFDGPGRTFSSPHQVAVIGAGLAGTATALALAEKGIRPILVDRGEGIAQGASAIPAAILHPRLTARPSTETRLRLNAYAFSAHRFRGRSGVTPSGILQLPGPRIDEDGLREMATTAPDMIVELVEPTEASRLAGIGIGTPGLFFADGMTISGARLAADLAAHPAIERLPDEPTADGIAVRCTGADIDGFDTLEVTGLAGQIDRFDCVQVPRLPLVTDGPVVPDAGSVWVGATYEYRRWPAGQAEAANAARFERLFGAPPTPSLARFRGIRAVTSDRLPVVGADAGTWFNLGHGSHGTSTAVLGAEIVASAQNGEVAPVTADILGRLDPGRFRERQKRRPNPFSTPRDGSRRDR